MVNHFDAIENEQRKIQGILQNPLSKRRCGFANRLCSFQRGAVGLHRRQGLDKEHAPCVHSASKHEPGVHGHDAKGHVGVAAVADSFVLHQSF